MNADLKQLIRLQSIDLSIQEIRTHIDKFPGISKALDAKLASPGQTFFRGIRGAADYVAGQAAHVAGLKAPDPETFIVELVEPQFTFRYVLAMTFAGVVPREVVQREGANFQYHLVGTGPYQLAQWKRGVRWQLVRNPHYTGADGNVDGIDIMIGADSTTATMMLERGEIDLVLADTPVPPTVHVKAYSHLLGDSDVTCFAAPALARRLRGGFPQSLTGAPMLLPGDGTVVRRQLEDWFQATGIRPAIVGEFDDSALMKAFGEQGAGVFVGPTVIGEEIRRQYRVQSIGPIDAVRERFYAISYERRIKHPAVVAIAEAARSGLRP